MLGLDFTNRGKTAPGRRASATASADTDLADPKRIAKLLARVGEARCMLSVAVPGSGSAYVSALLGVDIERGDVLIDEPSNATLEIATPLEISTRLDGILIRFVSQVRARDADAGGGLYRIAFPASLERRQRRAHHRAPVTQDLPVTATLHLGEDLFEGDLRDLSAGGMSLRLANGETWPGNSEPVPCKVRLSESVAFECALDVRRVGSLGDAAVLAGRFVGLERRSVHVLEKFVAGLEREALRRRPR